MNADEAMDKILELLDADDSQAVDELAEQFEDELDREEIFREAVRRGAKDYVSCHTDDVDLQDFYTGSSMLSETKDPDIRDILINEGASPDLGDFYDCRMFYETNSETFEIDDGLIAEMKKQVLQLTGLTREQFAEKMRDEETASEGMPEPLQNYAYEDIDSLLGITDEDGSGNTFDASPLETIDLLYLLDIDVEEESYGGAHGHDGWCIYYVR